MSTVAKPEMPGQLPEYPTVGEIEKLASDWQDEVSKVKLGVFGLQPSEHESSVIRWRREINTWKHEEIQKCQEHEELWLAKMRKIKGLVLNFTMDDITREGWTKNQQFAQTMRASQIHIQNFKTRFEPKYLASIADTFVMTREFVDRVFRQVPTDYASFVDEVCEALGYHTEEEKTFWVNWRQMQ